MPKATCVICKGPILSSRRRNACSPECKKQYKSLYDAQRYPTIADERIAYVSEWYQKNKAHKQAYDAEYRQRNREERLALQRVRSKARYWANPVESRQRSLRLAAMRRAKKTEAGDFVVLDRDLRRMLHRYRNACAECGSGFTESSPLEWDHVVPISRGGWDSIGNLLPLCRNCNRNKAWKLRVEWRAGVVLSVRDLAS